MLGQHVEPAVPPQRSRAPSGPGTPRWLSGGPIYLAVTEALRAPGKIPGCSGTRNLHDNLSDLRAQVAANQKGIQLVGELIGQYGLDVVQAYMGHIQVGWGQQGRQLCTRPQAGVQRRKGHLAHLEGTWLMLNSPPGKRGARCEGHAPGLWNCPAGPGPAPGGVCRGPHGRRLPYPTPSADQHESGQSWEGVGTSSGITGTPAGLLTSPQLWWAG